LCTFGLSKIGNNLRCVSLDQSTHRVHRALTAEIIMLRLRSMTRMVRPP
jgi:hypothetical protein